MPGSIVHLVVQQRLPQYLRESKATRYAELLLRDPCSRYTAFGSMGPDFLFFSLKEYGTPLSDLTNFIFGAYDSLRPLIEFYETYVEPVKQGLEDALSAADQAVFNGLLGQIRQTGQLLVTAAERSVEVLVVKKVDLFYPFYPKVQKGAREDSWYWCDYLHYRRTGRFCSNMWKLSQSDDDLKRYCLGYASHIGTDVAGHPFVNAVVGGPYRTHWHRHKLVENWIDAYARDQYRDSAQTRHCLRLTGRDKYRPEAISGSYYYRLCEFEDGVLPKKLGTMMLGAMEQTYGGTSGGIPHPVRFEFADLDTAYRLWLKWFEMATTIGSAVKPVPVPPPGAATWELVTDYTSGLAAIWSGGGGGGGGGFSLAGFFAAIWEFLKDLAESIWYTIDWLTTHFTDIVLLPWTEALALLKWLLYQIERAVWEYCDWLRFMLVLGGYLYPEPEDLLKQPYGLAFINTSYVQTVGGPYASFSSYPRRQEHHDLFGPMEHHLFYPGTSQELPSAEPAPVPFYGRLPKAFITGGYPYDPSIEKLFACVGPYGSSDKYTHFVDGNTWNSGQFGSALPFTARLIRDHMDDLPNLNLDGDRGYGWKTWRAKDPEHLDTASQVDVDYVDA
jgi:hypothetical protein